MAFEFLTELYEARMTKNSDNQQKLTYADCKERAYLILLMLQVMRYYPKHREEAAKYAYKTVIHREYRRFRIEGTDLYNLFYFITGDDAALDKLKDPEAAKQDRKRTYLSIGRLNGYLRSIGNKNSPVSRDYEILSLLERELEIRNNDYKELRRRLVTFDTDMPKERQVTVTRLLFAGRAKLSDSDFLQYFTALTIDKNLENPNLTSPEPTVSTPDQEVNTADIRNYRFLVPSNSLPFVAKFLQSARLGKTVLANFTQSYVPIILMIDDIVRAGPAHIEQLKQVHYRAKRSLKK